MTFKQFGLVVLCIFFLTGCVMPQTETTETTGPADGRHDVLYTCNCGPQCPCNTVRVRPGNCTCNAKLKWGHVLRVEGDEAILCQCHEGCKCGGLNPDDPTKCMCGNPVKRVKLSGTGIYFCNCGGACSCNTVSDQPGLCKCGMMLKKVE